MSESGMRSKLIRTLKSLDAVAVENPTNPGTPDVNYVDGWLELKWLRNWPKRPESVVQLEHYTPQQKLWIRRRTIAGGRCFLVLQCKREWLIFKHPVTMDVGKLTRQQLYDQVMFRFDKGLDKKTFIEIITEKDDEGL